jgi:hypothetical protein
MLLQEHLTKVASDLEECMEAAADLIRKGGGGGAAVLPSAPLGDGEAVRLRAEHRAALQEVAKAKEEKQEWDAKIKNAEEGQKVASEAFARTRKDMEVEFFILFLLLLPLSSVLSPSLPPSSLLSFSPAVHAPPHRLGSTCTPLLSTSLFSACTHPYIGTSFPTSLLLLGFEPPLPSALPQEFPLSTAPPVLNPPLPVHIADAAISKRGPREGELGAQVGQGIVGGY